MELIDFVSLYQFDEIYKIESIKDGEPSIHTEPSVSNEQDNKSESIENSNSEINSGKEEWLILGVEEDRKSVHAIFSSQPFSFSSEKFYFQEAERWSIEQIREYVKKSPATRLVFLGQTFEFLKLKPEPIERANKWYLYFPQTINSLKDTEKQTKLLFWNQLKKML